MLEEKKPVRKTHNLIIENRRTLIISGVSDVDSFDEVSVVIFTEMGMLTVKGDNIHISKLNLESGEMSVEGDIDAVIYSDDLGKKGAGLFARIFR